MSPNEAIKYSPLRDIIFYFIGLNSFIWLGEASASDTPIVAVASGSTATSTSPTWNECKNAF